jgi:uncharacterized protein
MFCPRCHTADLVEHDRDGIKIDICPGCRGVWLDRGELEKLIAADRQRQVAHPGDDDDDDDRRLAGSPRVERSRQRRDDDDDDDDDRRGRRRGWWDIFD